MASVEYQYSVQVKSRFDLLGRDDLNTEDPDLFLKKIKARQSEPKAASSAVKSKAASTSAAVSKEAAAPIRKAIRDNSDPGELYTEPRVVNAGDDQQVIKNESWEARGRGRGGFTRSRPAAVSGQRQFDRHSGSDKTGVKPVIKKDGHGTGNWGTIDDVIEIATASDVNIDEHLIEEEEEPAAEPVEEVKTLTLKEYRNQQKAAKPALQLLTKSSREANDGKDVFNNMIESHKAKPVQQPIVDVLEEDEEDNEEEEPVFFTFSRDNPPTSRSGGRLSDPSSFGRNQTHANADRSEQDSENVEQSDRSNQSTHVGPKRGGWRGGRGRGPFESDRSGKGDVLDSERGAGHVRGNDPERRGRGRGGLGAERGAGRGRGRGGFDVERGGRGRGRGRGNFDPERGNRGRGGSDPEHGRRGRGGFDPERGHRGRGGFDPERGHRGRRGFDPERGHRGRGGFDPERGHRGRGGFDFERGLRGRGGHDHEDDNAQVGMDNERRGSRGGRGRGFGISENGPAPIQRGRGSGFDRGRGFGGKERGSRGAGGFRNGHGTFEPNESEPKSVCAPAAPVMESEEDFPVLK